MIPWQPTALSGPKQAREVKPERIIRMLESSERPLIIMGPLLVSEKDCDDECDKFTIRELCINIAKKWDTSTVTLGPTFKSFLDDGFETEPMGIIEIVNLLKDPEWKGLTGKGQHDLVIFIGVTYYIASQGLSTLKHFAPHLKTAAICKFFHPNADVSFPNMNNQKWFKSLEKLSRGKSNV